MEDDRPERHVCAVAAHSSYRAPVSPCFSCAPVSTKVLVNTVFRAGRHSGEGRSRMTSLTISIPVFANARIDGFAQTGCNAARNPA